MKLLDVKVKGLLTLAPYREGLRVLWGKHEGNLCDFIFM